jgi:hypothetical protein
MGDPAHISCRIKVGKGFTPYKAGIVASLAEKLHYVRQRTEQAGYSV